MDISQTISSLLKGLILLLNQMPFLLFVYAIVAVIITTVHRIKRNPSLKRGLARKLSEVVDSANNNTYGSDDSDSDNPNAPDPYTTSSLLNGYSQGVTSTNTESEPLPESTLRNPTPLPPGFVRLDSPAATTSAASANSTTAAATAPASTAGAAFGTAHAGAAASIAAMLRNLPADYHVIDEVMIANGAGTSSDHATTATLDHVIVSPYGIFVIDEKNPMADRIEGDTQDMHWRAGWSKDGRINGPVNDMVNPVLENVRYLQALSHIIGVPLDRFVSIIVFCGDGFDLSALTGRKRLLSSTKGMPYPTRIITSAELPGVFADYRTPLLDAFTVQMKTTTIGSLSVARPNTGTGI
ncbi:NERD domain-containing protein [Bifidobacterium sp. 64T4]|uniref:nuclease-related domain-containing protein n=1 Tax=Bifidobacterium pongonis TaxID=2834432 RepID=UPI001C595CB0|nr:nuclease-related domain-containing protein [Bifidobacterium pongonis]MBW3094126.1 NERD domain-containing protein [Bifidobacterium pongonis]